MNVGPNDSTINVVNNTTGDTTKSDVSPGKDTQVQIPNVPDGTIIYIEIGRGMNRKIITVLVIALGP